MTNRSGPNTTPRQDQEDQERSAELESMQAEMAEPLQEAVESSRVAPLPVTVAAYQAVYGDFSRGWPPELEG